MKRIIALLLTALLVCSILAGCAPQAADNTSKAITFRVTHADTSTKDFQFTTTASTLAEALIEQGIIVAGSGDNGLYNTIDGETADWNDGESWWCFSKGGVDLTVGIEQQQITDGEHYEAIFKRGM